MQNTQPTTNTKNTEAKSSAGRGRKTFHAYAVALEIDGLVGEVVGRIRTKNRHLADQGDRSSQSLTLNVAEGNRRRGRDRTHMFTTALTSADELETVLDLAVGRRYMTETELTPLRDLLDREKAMLYRLIHGRRA